MEISVSLGVIAIIIGVAGILVVALPWLLVWLDRSMGLISEEKAAQQLTNYRQTVVQTVGGIVVIAGLYLTWNEIQIREMGQITDPFSVGVEQLAHEDLEVRLGGVHALNQVAEDSPENRRTVMKTLAAFVRENANTDQDDIPKNLRGNVLSYDPPSDQDSADVKVDIQAAVTALAHLPRRDDSTRLRIDLSNTDLTGLELRDGDISNVILRGANLSRATLIGVDLSETDLILANLSDAILYRKSRPAADVRGRDVATADLSGAYLPGANLTGAQLTEADLSGASLYHTNLDSTNLAGANLSNANLVRADLTDAKLSGVTELCSTETFRESNLGPRREKVRNQCPEKLPTSDTD